MYNKSEIQALVETNITLQFKSFSCIGPARIPLVDNDIFAISAVAYCLSETVSKIVAAGEDKPSGGLQHFL